jgi:hypothetical protein
VVLKESVKIVLVDGRAEIYTWKIKKEITYRILCPEIMSRLHAEVWIMREAEVCCRLPVLEKR